MLSPELVCVRAQSSHSLSKHDQAVIQLLAGIGVTVQARSRAARDPNQPYLREVDVIESERLIKIKLALKGFSFMARNPISLTRPPESLPLEPV